MKSILSWLSTRWWIFVIIAAIGATIWNHSARISHVTYLSNLAGGEQIEEDPDSPTGYKYEFRKLVATEKNADSFQWIMQVQKMFESGVLLLRHVDYDNAPEGRSVRTASLYRWWLGGIAWVHSSITNTPIGISVERAALVADPIAHVIFVLITAIVIARSFGGWSAALFTVGFVTIFPLGAAFAPGQPDDSTLLLACAIWSVLLLATSISKSTHAPGSVTQKQLHRSFLAAGSIGGIGLWIGVAGMLPVLAGIVLATACCALVFNRKASKAEARTAPLPWRLWSIGGATLTLVAWLVDRSPAFFESSSWQSDFVHPLHSLAWLGCGELLTFLDSKDKSLTKLRKLTLICSTVAICALAYTILFRGSVEGWSIDPVPVRLTRLQIDPTASNLANWFGQPTTSALLIATLVPATLIIIGAIALLGSKASATNAKATAIVIIPTLFAAVFATMQLGWWNLLGGLALVLAVVIIATAQKSGTLKWWSRGTVLFAAIMGVTFVYSDLDQTSRSSVSRAELETLMERHIAQWLARRADLPNDGALAPPNVSVSLAYFGNLRVLGTPYPENSDGFSVAVRLSAASSADEARALTTGREINMIVHPSWDTFLEDYARLGSEQPESSFIALLNRWLPPRWLEPVTFQLPNVPGFESEWVVIFRTVEVQDNASAIGRLVEYFIYSGRDELAARAQAALESNFPGELVTHITAAELAISRGDRLTFTRSVNSIIESIKGGSDFYLTWEFRVNMALVLAGAKQIEETKTQIERCIEEADINSIRRLSTSSLSGLLHLAKALNIEFPDPDLKEFAITLLPSDQQADFR